MWAFLYGCIGDNGSTRPVDAGPSDAQSHDAQQCVATCSQDHQCQASCPPVTNGSNCCDVETGTCYQSSRPTCPPPLDGQNCYLSQTRFYNECNSDFYYPAQKAYVTSIEGKTYLLILRNFDVAFFDLTDPSQPRERGARTMPFPTGCGLPFGCGDSHFQYIRTIQDLSIAPTKGYAFAPLRNMGWDMLRIRGTGITWMGTGYHGRVDNDPYVTGVLFEHEGQLYLVSQRLDRASVLANDSTVRLYSLGVTPPANLYESLSQGPALPLGELQSAPMGSIRLFLFETLGRRYIVAYRNGRDGLVIAADVTEPANPVFAGRWSRAESSFLFEGVWGVDPVRPILWIANSYKPSGVPTLYRIPYTVAPGHLMFGTPQAYPWHDQVGVAPSAIDVSQDMLWVSSAGFQWSWRTAVFRIDESGRMTRFPNQVGISEFFPGQECPLDVTSYAILARGNQRHVYRTASMDAEVITINPACL